MAAKLPWKTKAKTRGAEVPWGSSEALAEALRAAEGGEIRVDEPMSRHTTLKVGGPADVLVFPPDEAAVARVLAVARRLKAPVTLVGNGSNLLVRDGGIEGVALSLKGLDGMEILDDAVGRVRAGAGVPMARLIRLGLEQGYEGIWFLTGIPGTVGGALRMNAGTRHGEIARVVDGVRILTSRGVIKDIEKDALQFEYRQLHLDAGSVILSGLLTLGRAEDPAEIRRLHRDVLEYRSATQPLQLPACGSVFRNPPKDAAGRLIEQAGLKGVRIRGAQVSEQHANWIVNVGGATATDVLLLMRLLHERVLEASRVELHPEVVVVGVDAAGET